MPDAGWSTDPTGRHDLRWFDGTDWTDQVADAGVVSADPTGDGTTIPGAAHDAGSITQARSPVVTADAGYRVVGPASDPDRYRLLQVVASGGEGTLWKASLTVDSVELPVAVKALHARNAEMLDEWSKRWQAQSELLRSLDHPNVVRVREVFEGADPHPAGAVDPSGHSLYLVMSWVDGESLAEWVTARPARDPHEVALIVSKLAAAVDYLHAGPLGGHAVLHRDIKPANVIVSGSDVTLVDFGLIRVLSGSPLTQATGSPQYWAPEVALGQEYSEAADRYSLGATAYYLFTALTPSPGDPQAMRAALEGVTGIEDPPAFADHVLAMLSPVPAERPSSASAWARDLAVGALSGRYSPHAATVARVGRPSGTDTAASPRTKRRKGRWVALTAAVVLACAAVAFLLRPASSSGDRANATERSGSTTSSEIQVVDPRVPSVLGSDLESAQAELTELGFEVTVAYEDSAEPAGTVLAQSPRAGGTGTTKVELTVARAPTALPDVTGQRLAAATATLEGLGVEVTTIDVLSEEAADGTVLEQDPPAGSVFSPTVTLKVARRPVVTFLADVDPVEGQASTGAGRISGTTYTRSLLHGSSGVGRPIKVGFDMARAYRNFRTTIGLSDESRSGAVARVEVFGDGRAVFSEDVLLGQALPIDLDITGVLRLELVITKLAPDDYHDMVVVWGDAQVLGAQGDVPANSQP